MEKEQKQKSLLDRWKNKEKDTINANSLKKAPVLDKIPLSNGQKRLWFLQQMYPKNPFYNYCETYTLEGKLSEKALIESLKKIYSTNDILRTTYHIDDGEVFQKVNNTSELTISKHDLSNLSEIDCESELDKIIQEDIKLHFDLAKAPLIRCTLIKKRDTENLLLITMHHIIIDEWSMKIFREKLSSYYKNINNVESKIDNLIEDNTLQYTDYAFWQSKNNLNNKHLSYWKNKLSGEIPVLDLPTDFIRPIQPNFKGAFSKTETYNKNISDKIILLSQEYSTTPYVIMLSVYFTFLHWYSGQNDILVGSPITNRDQKALEDILGFFIDTVILRTEIDSSMSFRDLVLLVRKNTLEAFTNKNVSFDLLVKELNIERSLSTNPFFQVMFVYNEEVEIPPFDENLRINHKFLDTKVSKFDLTIFITKTKDTFTSKFEFSTELFKETTINSFLEHFKILLKGILDNPEQKISQTSILTDSDKLLYSYENLNLYNFENTYGIHSMIEAIAKKNPKSIAVTSKGSSLSYKELNDKANILAYNILKFTKSNNSVVGLCTDRSTNIAIGILGILKAGCCYLPIDSEYPQERIDFMLEDSQSNIVVTQTDLTEQFNPNKFSILSIDTMTSDNFKNIKLPVVDNSHLAYIIYTSGSTGKPKGVPITHKNIINSTLGRFEFYNQKPSAFLLMSSISFDSSKAGIFWTLCAGGNLVISEKRIEQDIDELGNIIQNHNITHTLMLPSLYNLMLNYVNYSKIKTLNTVIVAGEVCDIELCRLHIKTLPKVSLFNEYGPTEASVWCIAHKITHEDLDLNIVPIGKPVANSKIYLLNKNLRPVPQGAVGEIYIGGLGLSSGYINRQDLTEKVFIKHAIKTEERLYKTGDLGRYNANGNIIFIGRADHQIKIRGYRVELSEIENTINTYSPDISNSIVLLEDDLNRNIINDENMSDETLLQLLETLSKEDLNTLFSK